MTSGDRVRLSTTYVEKSTSPHKFRALRGLVLNPTPHVENLGESYRLVLWDDASVAYPVRTEYLEIDHDFAASPPPDECD